VGIYVGWRAEVVGNDRGIVVEQRKIQNGQSENKGLYLLYLLPFPSYGKETGAGCDKMVWKPSRGGKGAGSEKRNAFLSVPSPSWPPGARVVWTSRIQCGKHHCGHHSQCTNPVLPLGGLGLAAWFSHIVRIIILLRIALKTK
jgi:hypothetical protein